jgi:hypothetical protein
MHTFAVSTTPDGPVTASFPLNLQDAPKHAEALGHLVAAFAALEFTMFQLFRDFLRADLNMARIVFYGLTAFRTKSEMTLSLARVRYKHNSDVAALEDLLKRISKTANKRNQYIHDLWCTDVDKDACQFRWGTKAAAIEASKIKVQDIEQLTAQIRHWSDELEAFMAKPRQWAS